MVTMAKRKPAKRDSGKSADLDKDNSVTVRVPPDIKRMVKWICEFEGGKAQDLMSELCLDRLTARFQPYIEDAKRAEALERQQADQIAEVRRRRSQG